ncbi:MAG TPA: type II secretion system protein N [Dokdonella sp.]
MRPAKTLLLLLALALIAGGLFVWWMPAELAYRYGGRYLGAATLTGLRGTLWDGHADGVSVLGRDLGELDWHARKGPLLRGRLVADVRVKGADVDVAGAVTREADGSLLAHDLRFSVPAEILAPVLDLGGARLLGTIDGVVGQARFATTALSDVSGSARWSGAGVSGQRTLTVSDLLADFASRPDGSVGGSVRDDGRGELVVDGTFTVTFAGFDAQATLAARDRAGPLAESLRSIGEPQADGTTRIVVHGRTLNAL